MNTLIVLGTSTGGPKALTHFLGSLPALEGAAICIVQHMPAGFTANLAKRLNDLSDWQVAEGEANQPIVEGHAYIAPGGMQMRVCSTEQNQYLLSIHKEEPIRGHQPSVDVLFDSTVNLGAEVRVIGVVLTGMGRDGAQGLLGIRQRGGFTVAESQDTAVVYGMPKAAKENGSAMVVAPLSDIARVVQSEVERSGRR